MLDSLTSRLTGILDRLRGFGRLTEDNIQEALREVRVALLEADVNFKVVKSFVERVREKAVGQDVLQVADARASRWSRSCATSWSSCSGGSGHRLAMALAPADGRHAGRPAGLRQDHHAPPSSPATSRSRASIRSWPPPTSTGPPRSTS